jgi:hypothetical protein
MPRKVFWPRTRGYAVTSQLRHSPVTLSGGCRHGSGQTAASYSRVMSRTGFKLQTAMFGTCALGFCRVKSFNELAYTQPDWAAVDSPQLRHVLVHRSPNLLP